MTRKQKEALAFAVISRVADIVEFWGEESVTPSELRHLSAEQVRAQLATWMRVLPGSLWDSRLEEVKP